MGEIVFRYQDGLGRCTSRTCSRQEAEVTKIEIAEGKENSDWVDGAGGGWSATGQNSNAKPVAFKSSQK